MAEDRILKRRAYEAAAARLRSFHERYFPLDVLGGKPALPMTPEAHLELTRLGAERDAAHTLFQTSLVPPETPQA